MEIMYEITRHFTKEDITGATRYEVFPITILRRGILEGCTGESITARDRTGRKFLGSPSDYYATEAEAWKDVYKELEDTIKHYKEEAVHDARNQRHTELVLESLRSSGKKIANFEDFVVYLRVKRIALETIGSVIIINDKWTWISNGHFESATHEEILNAKY